MNVLRLLLPTWLALAACLPCSGMFVREETETVPIERLLPNVEKRDGLLEGAELKGLAIWHDANSNGVSEPGEVQPLSQWGIAALSCSHQTHSTGIPFSPTGVRFKDGTTRPSYDWIVPGRHTRGTRTP